MPLSDASSIFVLVDRLVEVALDRLDDLGPKGPIVLDQGITGEAGQQLGMAAEEDAGRQREQPTERER